MDTPLELAGRWWLPDSPEVSVDGDLTADLSGIRLELHKPVSGPPVDNVGAQTWSLGTRSYPVVHGAPRNGEVVTLLDMDGVLGLDASGMTESLRAQVCLTGSTWAHRDAFTQASVEFDALDAWLPTPSVISAEDDRDWRRFAVDVSEHELGVVSIDGDRIAFVSGACGSWGDDSIHLSRLSMIRIDLVEPLGWQAIVRGHLRPLQDFLTVALGRPINLTRLLLRPEGGDERDGLLTARLSLTQAGPTVVGAADVIGYRAPTLLTGSEVAALGWDIVARWYEVRARFAEVVIELNAPLYAPFNYGSVRYGAIVRAAEAAHARLGLGGRQMNKEDHRTRVAEVVAAAQAAGVDDDTITWAANVLATRNDKSFPARVAEVVAHAGALGATVVHRSDAFAADVAKARHAAAHGGGAPEDRAALIRRHWLGEVLSWVLRVILLQESGVTDAARRALDRYSLRYALSQIAQGDQRVEAEFDGR